ncbi:MAG: rhamnulokinase [Candidatus Omnitrophica bacterium]|nr:rhamnulokinase [Candidatus Omnitrophota bacterium]
MSNRCYLGVDLGAESGRVMAGLFDGEKIILEELRRFPNGPVQIGGTLRWDVLGLWSEIKKGLASAAQKYGRDISSVGVDTWGVDYVLLSQNNEIIGQPFHYRDARTRGMMNKAFQRVSREDIFAETGLQFLELNTLYQLLAAQQNTPEIYTVADSLLMMPDFFHWCLSGAKVSEFTEATTSQCLHPTKKNWAYDLLKQFEIPTHIFPEIVPPGAKVGSLLGEIAAETGLGRIDVVAPAAHDTGSAVAAVPTQKTGQPVWAYISSGTWSLVGAEINAANLNKDVLNLNFTNEGGVDDTYRLLKNIMGLWLVQRCKLAFEQRGNCMGYDELIQRAEREPAFRSLLNPDDQRFLNPADMTEAMSGFCRETHQPTPETEGQFIRCALESLALKYNEVIQSVEKLTGFEIEVIHIVGGGTQNQLLNQFTADACNKPVVTGPIEATVLGNVLVQARTSGEIGSLEEIRSVVRASCELQQYEPQNPESWMEAKQRFSQLLSHP